MSSECQCSKIQMLESFMILKVDARFLESA